MECSATEEPHPPPIPVAGRTLGRKGDKSVGLPTSSRVRIRRDGRPSGATSAMDGGTSYGAEVAAIGSRAPPRSGRNRGRAHEKTRWVGRTEKGVLSELWRCGAADALEMLARRGCLRQRHSTVLQSSSRPSSFTAVNPSDTQVPTDSRRPGRPSRRASRNVLLRRLHAGEPLSQPPRPRPPARDRVQQPATPGAAADLLLEPSPARVGAPTFFNNDIVLQLLCELG